MKNKKSVYLSLCLCLTFSAVLLIMLFAAPATIKWYINLEVARPYTVYNAILVAFYVSALPAAVCLYSLVCMLLNFLSDKVFIKGNVLFLSVIAACVLVVAAVCFGAGFYYPPFFIVLAAALFIGVILIVVRNAFNEAVKLKAENELTI